MKLHIVSKKACLIGIYDDIPKTRQVFDYLCFIFIICSINMDNNINYVLLPPQGLKEFLVVIITPGK